ncbi:ribonuclease H-like domain-containing protein [Tanacetum coccineum]
MNNVPSQCPLKETPWHNECVTLEVSPSITPEAIIDCGTLTDGDDGGGWFMVMRGERSGGSVVRDLCGGRLQEVGDCFCVVSDCVGGGVGDGGCMKRTDGVRGGVTWGILELRGIKVATLDESMLWHRRLVVTDDYSRFTWDFFLASKDETSGILKSFITEIENLADKKVKIIRCDNGTKFKNRVMSEFYEKKCIKREFSIARTP